MYKFARLFILVLLFSLLIGCSTRQTIKADIYVRVNEDRSGSYQLTVLADPLLIPLTTFLQKRLRVQGFTIQPFNQGHKSGWTAQKKVKNILQSPPSFATTTMANKAQKMQHVVQSENYFFWKRVKINYDLDLSQIDRELPLQSFSPLFYDRVDLDLHLILPLKAKQHNAAQVSDDGKTLTWPLHLGKHNPLSLSIDVPNPLGWIISGIVLLLGILFGIVFYRKKRKSTG